MVTKGAALVVVCMACTAADALGQEIEMKPTAAARFERKQKAAAARRLIISGAVTTILGDVSVAVGLGLYVTETSTRNFTGFSYLFVGPSLLVTGALAHLVGVPLLLVGAAETRNVAAVPRIDVGPGSARATWTF